MTGWYAERTPDRSIRAMIAATLLAAGSSRVTRLNGSKYADDAEQEGSHYSNLVQLDRSQYTEVR